MASKPSQPTPPRPSGLQAMLARLRGMADSLKADHKGNDQAPPLAEPVRDIPVAQPVVVAEPSGSVPEAMSVPEEVPGASPAVLDAVQPEPDTLPTAPNHGDVEVADLAAPETPAAPSAQPQVCPYCNSPRAGTQSYCDNCGWIFPAQGETPAPAPAAAGAAVADPGPRRLRERYEVQELVSERGGVSRYRGRDFGSGTTAPAPVFVIQAAASVAAEPVLAAEAVPAAEEASPDSGDTLDDEVLPSFDEPPTAEPVAEAAAGTTAWPGIAWERELLQKAQHPAVPRVLDTFTEGNSEYLIEEAPVGQSFWDSWDDPSSTAERRFSWLKQVAEALHRLHQAGAIFEALRPDVLAIGADGQVKLTDLSDLLPLPVPADASIRGTLYTAPELLVARDKVDARADLYGFGAMLYSLHVGRELSEMDFERQGTPKPFIPRFPDVHPLFGRLISKTFCRDVDGRFPTDEAAKEDASGFIDLIRTLEVCRRTLDSVRLEIAAWTTTGMVRTGNEDAFALLHAVESRQDDLGDSALVLLADGMGGYEAGEVAAALAIQELRKNLLQQKPFAVLAGGTAFPLEHQKQDAPDPDGQRVENLRKLILAALKEANKAVFTAARNGIGRRGMGCTAEVVYVNGRNVVVGHVGDSRTYHLCEGRLVQLTRDQTLVNRLVELGTLSPEEAENHPRRSELQQALGGRSDVEPALYSGAMKPGDWVIVCSDGVSNHVTSDEFKQMLQNEATSAEMAARRLVNFTNIKGATDNATVVVIRAT